MELTAFEGRHNSEALAGHASFAGTLPDYVAAFGGMSLEVNAARRSQCLAPATP